jgi:hypothetical protein
MEKQVTSGRCRQTVGRLDSDGQSSASQRSRVYIESEK